jgi:UDP-N-acetylglucosamine 2-epimerase
MKILSVVGARPEFVQVAPLCRVLRKSFTEVLVHTGQHYDDQMSKVFFEELAIPKPDYDLEVGSGSHAAQTATMLVRLEEVMLKERPQLAIIRGDTNSTLAAALVAAKLDIPIVHVEAGERSFNRTLPEETNRVVADRLTETFLCVSRRAADNLAREGFRDGVHVVGDVMYDALLHALPIARKKSDVLARLQLQPKGYVLATVHRAATTADPALLRGILEGLGRLGVPVAFPMHPRTAAAVKEHGLTIPARVNVVEPFGYFDMLVAEENARAIVTDSGGVQREAYCLSIPCMTLRHETEWTETVDAGWNRLTGTDADAIVAAFEKAAPLPDHPPIFGDGHAAEKIAEILLARR